MCACHTGELRLNSTQRTSGKTLFLDEQSGSLGSDAYHSVKTKHELSYIM
jgi:hypothetical protein